ncbi:hypothetical protein [Celeribacter sp.]|uniref:hypothetical protein n=1 Tax=Celeribacter sp. TaxID=1890673 RepID=UPI003A9492BF
MDNFERSEIVIAKILDNAIEIGIQEWTLQFSNLMLDDEYAPYFYPCLKWLEAEGIIRVEAYHRTIGDIAGGVVQNISLTSYGLVALGHTIKIGDDTDKMSEAVKKVSSGEKSYAQVGDFLGGILGGFTKSISS